MPSPKSEEDKQAVVWFNAVSIAALHAYSLYVLLFDTQRMGWRLWVHGLVVLQLCSWGVSAGVHRLWSHRSYKASWPLRVALALCYSATGQYSIVAWVRDHRVHHKHTETDADPHDVRRGFFFSHVGWYMTRKRRAVLEAGNTIDLSDLQADPVVIWQHRHADVLRLVLCYVLPTALPVLWWGESLYLSWAMNLLRVTVGANCTGSINSFAHMFGNKPFNSRIHASENWLVSVVCSGEAWHNYHHVFPWDYRTSEHHFLNTTAVFLDVCGFLGLASHFKTASTDLVAQVARQHGDGSHQQREVPYRQSRPSGSP